ncbi:MAG TPA: phosphoribosylformylglycinamidine synthase subunit PurQ [Candidatus Thermoplasmatota archaeon]|nr:phosphoribosylformylglycinamidine synthase subunit PurQ [Candidatus Thermoplasmatota archaeon]
MVKRSDVRVAVLRIEGTNNEQEMWDNFHALGAKPELVHLNQLVKRDLPKEERRSLSDYHVLMLPGGFSAGDYIRAGAIYAARMKAAIPKEIEEFVAAEKPIGGMCNGFQILVELGLLPGQGKTLPPVPDAVLNRNDSALFECRPTLLKHENRGKCVFTRRIPRGEVRLIPSAHAEGKLMLPAEIAGMRLQQLADNDQVVFTYTDPSGGKAAYPWSPSGSMGGVAGICNEMGTVFGMMPHPERVFWRWQHPDWTRDPTRKPDDAGDGRAVFESVLDYVEKKF